MCLYSEKKINGINTSLILSYISLIVQKPKEANIGYQSWLIDWGKGKIKTTKTTTKFL